MPEGTKILRNLKPFLKMPITMTSAKTNSAITPVTARGKAKPDGSPTDVDRELIVLFGEFDENTSWFTQENARVPLPVMGDPPTLSSPGTVAATLVTVPEPPPTQHRRMHRPPDRG